MKSISGSSWTRDYIYDTDTNQLLRHTKGGMNIYAYDAHGNITKMSHLQTMSWDYQDNFKFADLGGSGEVYYIYDSSGE